MDFGDVDAALVGDAAGYGGCSQRGCGSGERRFGRFFDGGGGVACGGHWDCGAGRFFGGFVRVGGRGIVGGGRFGHWRCGFGGFAYDGDGFADGDGVAGGYKYLAHDAGGV